MLPILHLNGFKISNATILSHIEPQELEQLLRGCGWTPYFVEGDDPAAMHKLMAATIERAVGEIREIQDNARASGNPSRPRWPMILLRSPKGWTGPKELDGLRIEGTFRTHQVPILVGAAYPDHVAPLEDRRAARGAAFVSHVPFAAAPARKPCHAATSEPAAHLLRRLHGDEQPG